MKYLIIALLFAAVEPATASTSHFRSGSTHVALIELYTSEGCSSCPPAEAWLGGLRDAPGLWTEFVPVQFHVNYWDNLGWVDTLASRAFTEREYAYAAAWTTRSVYTPCFVRDGSEWKPAYGQAVRPAAPAGELSLDVGADGACRATYRPRVADAGQTYVLHLALLGGGISQRVSAGENRGSTLEHEFVALGLEETPLRPAEGSDELRAVLPLPAGVPAQTKRRAVAAWVTVPGGLAPIQAVGGWIP